MVYLGLAGVPEQPGGGGQLCKVDKWEEEEDVDDR